MSRNGHVHQRDDELSLCRANAHRPTHLLCQWNSHLCGPQENEHNYRHHPIRQESRGKTSRCRTPDHEVRAEDGQLPLLHDHVSHAALDGHVSRVRTRLYTRGNILYWSGGNFVIYVYGKHGQCLYLCFYGTNVEEHCFW